MPFSFTPQAAAEYQRLFDTCVINLDKLPEINLSLIKFLREKHRYEALANKVGIPWHFIGITHSLEAGCDFNKHLHNGDPLNARTVQIPKNRPKTGNPPFTWEFSAEDALTDLAGWNDWSVPGMLYKLEGYNGYGYHSRGINSPYLWSFSNHYTKGKFVRDREFSPTAVSKQCGAGHLIKKAYRNTVRPG
jgi:lysozyme family protein